jgi:hypothetical protein
MQETEKQHRSIISKVSTSSVAIILMRLAFGLFQVQGLTFILFSCVWTTLEFLLFD